jgi:hypothetical protein
MEKRGLDISEVLDECVSYCRKNPEFNIERTTLDLRADHLSRKALLKRERIERRAKKLQEMAERNMANDEQLEMRTREHYMSLAEEEGEEEIADDSFEEEF